MPQPNNVVILMGSRNDWEIMKAAADTLREFGVSHEARVLSAHRTPRETADYVRTADAAGTQVFIAAAGMAAHLAVQSPPTRRGRCWACRWRRPT